MINKQIIYNMSNKEKLYALKPSFIKTLYEDYLENYLNKNIRDFLIDINLKYGDELANHCVPGDTNIYLDDEIRFKINTESEYSDKAEWDCKYSKLLYSKNDKTNGIYTLNNTQEISILNKIQSTDVRVWNYLSLFKLHKYVIKRWGDSDDSSRIFIRKLSNQSVARHSILRLYWTSDLTFDASRSNSLELLDTLWLSQDFMTQVTERSISNTKEQILFFLEYCSNKELEKILFKTRSNEGYPLYRKFIKLFLADSNLLTIANCNKDEIENLLDENLKSCIA